MTTETNEKQLSVEVDDQEYKFTILTRDEVDEIMQGGVGEAFDTHTAIGLFRLLTTSDADNVDRYIFSLHKYSDDDDHGNEEEGATLYFTTDDHTMLGIVTLHLASLNHPTKDLPLHENYAETHLKDLFVSVAFKALTR